MKRTNEPEPDALGTPKAFSENERDFLLKANGGDKEWKVLGKSGVTVVFETVDRALRAQYDVAGHTLVIFTQEGGKRMQDAKKAEEEKKLKGL